MPVLQKLSTPLSINHITALVAKAINPLHDLLTFVTTRVVVMENIFAEKMPPLDQLYSNVSGRSSQPATTMLASRLKTNGLRLSSLELHSHSNSSGGLGSIMPPPPLNFTFFYRVGGILKSPQASLRFSYFFKDLHRSTTHCGYWWSNI